MAIDASIYSNLKPIEAPNVGDAMQKGMTLANLGMQNQQMQLQMQTQQAMRDAYAANTDANGNLNRQGVLSSLGRINPMAAAQLSQQWTGMDKNQAEAQAAQADAVSKIRDATMPGLLYLNSAKPEDKPAIFHRLMSQYAANHISMQNVPSEFSQAWLDDTIGKLKQSKSYAEQQSAVYGSRSPNAELTSQYGKDVAPIRTSQMAFQQMNDNYHHPSPQGDASLVLNAFKIKFPTAPDVNSLKELAEAQSAPDQWKQMATRVLSGGLDQNTRDNLMRDAISTFRGNVTSFRGIQSRYQARAKAQNVDDQTITSEPAIESSYKDALELQDKLGPYVPPSDRPGGGFMANANRLAANLLGVNSGSKKQAAPNAGTGDDGVAYAGTKASPPPNGMILMQAPNGTLKYIPISQKGAAIANGGKVIR